MYENLSWIHDIHYRWGLPFCTPVSGAEFSMIRTPTTTLPPTPFLSFSHLSLHSFLLPHALPLKRCFIPHQVPFIPLQPFGLLSFHPSISQTLHLYFHPSACPSFTYSAPPPYHRPSEQGTVRLVRWEPAGPPPAVPPYVDLSPPALYWFCFKQVKTTRRMRCRRWREIKNIGKGERGKKRERPSLYQIYDLSPGCIKVIVRRLLYRGWTQKEGKRWSGVEERESM